MQYGKYSPVKFANFVYFLYVQTRKPMTFEMNVVGFPKTYANICKICKLRRAIFPVFYKISPPNCAVY